MKARVRLETALKARHFQKGALRQFLRQALNKDQGLVQVLGLDSKRPACTSLLNKK